MTQQKELSVAAIKNGTVIDHITAGQALTIVRILGLSSYQQVITVGLHLPSRAMGAKDLIKIEGREVTPEEANQVALFAPEATVNIIRNYQTAKKFMVELPKSVASFIICPNPKCITNNERMNTVFEVAPGKPLKVRCHYCEKIFLREEIKDYTI